MSAEASRDGREGVVRHALVFVDGAQRGASAPLADGVPTTLGSALERDVVLSDPRVPEHAMTFVPAADGLSVEVHADGVTRDGQPLEPGTYRFAGGETLALGNARLVLAANLEAVSAGPSGTDEDGEAMAPAAWLSFDEEEGPAVEAERSVPFTPLATVLFAVTLFGALAIGVSYWLHGSSAGADGVSTAAVVEPPPTAIPRLLSGGGFDDVTYVTSANAGPRLTGHVASRARLLELQRLVRDANPRARIEVHVQDEIVQGVEDFYRTHGIEASVEPGEAGIVKVVTRVAEEERLAGVETKAMGDVAGLTLLQTRNEPPDVEPKEEKSPARRTSVEEEGKRVVAVIAGDPSYVVTVDDSRYFVGSSLPSGHTITEIDEDSVLLDHEGEQTRLRF